MKYGVLYNKTNRNIGDDIQAYAAARFLPRIDYLVDRERIDEFVSENNEPVAVIMNAWYMWAKWHWPPASCIIPKFIGFHYADHQLSKQPGSPFKYEFLHGIGGDYLKANSPIGCRDIYTLNQLQSLGIDSYFSGCITMTLPNMPERNDRGRYICLVDLDAKVTKKIQSMYQEQDIEIKVVTHTRERDEAMTWEDRTKIVTDLLTLYQNARCVVTKKLHCSLPCLALGTPVFLIKEMEDDIRFSPYYDFLHRTTTTKFMRDQYTYDFMNPLENKKDFLPIRDRLIQEAEAFVKAMEQNEQKLNAFPYTEEQLIRWRHDTMKIGMDKWLICYRTIQKDLKKKQKEIAALRTQVKLDTPNRNTRVKKMIKKLLHS